ncbi:DUF4184 family protein [Streptomyces sp. NPDC058691]|uniref:DUF4184 family protein n=1 Tax=Streptomyces sp. NPDC058691 TaxID=3346601 RepID=UPI00365D98E9
MPFTLSHPAAVVMVARHPLVIPALVMGSVAPDVAEFTGIKADHPVWWEPFFNLTYTHSFPGIGIDVVYALLLVLLYMLAKRPVLAMVPKLAARLREAPGYGGGWGGAARRALWTSISALIGVVTHLVWDSFTHYGMFVDEHFSFMRTPVIGGLDVLRFLQYVSSVAGLVVIGFWIRRKLRGAVPVPLAPGLILGSRARSAVIFALVTACGMGAVPRALEGDGVESTELLLRRIVTGGGLGIALGLVLYSFVWHAAHIGPARRAAGPSGAQGVDRLHAGGPQ